MRFNYPAEKDIATLCCIQGNGCMPPGTKYYKVSSFENMVKLVAHLHFKNPSYLLLYRGQERLYVNTKNIYSFYPSIFRGNNKDLTLKSNELKERFEKLEEAKDFLEQSFPKKYFPSSALKTSLLYSIIQHYELAPTPFLDLTHSLQVAYSFGCLKKPKQCYIAIFGFPQLQGNQILYKQRPSIVNIPLQYCCPPDTLRPHFQEAYSIGLNNITNNNQEKALHNQKKNLIAIIEIPANEERYQLGEDYLQLNEEPDFIKEVKKSLSNQL